VNFLCIALVVLTDRDYDDLLWVDEERPLTSSVFTQDRDETFQGTEDGSVNYHRTGETRFVRHIVLLVGVFSFKF
jgi:hypothetical protein